MTPTTFVHCLRCLFLLFILNLFSLTSYAQDVDITVGNHFLKGENIIKIKRNHGDNYAWALTDNNHIYRINTDIRLLGVEDFTSKFSDYSSEKFIDIVGTEKDEVFLATKSKVLVLNGNTLKTVYENKGSSGEVNAVGRFSGSFNAGEPEYSEFVLIATDKSVLTYNLKTKLLYSSPEEFNGRIFFDMYRGSMASRFERDKYDWDGVKFFPMYYHITSVYLAYLWLGDKFGSNVNTAYFTRTDLDMYPEDGSLTNLYWTTDDGFFQMNANASSHPATFYKKHLTGIKVNKITSIYGLSSFWDRQNEHRVKENLLVGTNVGLYYTNSIFMQHDKGLNKLNFNRFTPLNGKKINDIAINHLQPYNTRFCENGVWIATVDGLYFLKVDYSKNVDPLLTATLAFKNTNHKITEIDLCGQQSVIAEVDGYSDLIHEWYKDDILISDAKTNQYQITRPGRYKVILRDLCSGIKLKTNILTVTQTIGPAFTFNYPNEINICDKQPYTLKATGNAAYSYRWYKDGVLTGNTTSTLSATASGEYKVEVSACPDSWVSSKEVQITFIDLPVATLAADKAVYCQGEQARLTINIPVSPKYNIYWLRDGVVVNELTNEKEARTNIAGTYTVNVNSTADAACTQPSQPLQLQFTSTPAFNFNYPDVVNTCAGRVFELKADGSSGYNYRWFKNNVQLNITTNTLPVTESGSYRVEASACSGSWVPSKTIKVNVITVPVISLSANKAAYCDGDNATLSINTSSSSNYIIRWWHNGDPLIEATDKTNITINKPGNYSVTIEGRDVAACTQVSNMLVLDFSPQPTLSIQQVASTTLCEGSTVELRALHPLNANGVVTWSSGQTGDVLSVSRSGNYTAELRTPAGCTISESINVNLLPNPVLNLTDAELCPYDNESVTLNAPAGYVNYLWNGQPGGPSYTVNRVGNVNLTVTDFNGCSATQIIKVANKCDDIKIPNTFTPNGDGINDTWNISGIQGNNNLVVKVYNRNGSLVFESAGYPTPWDGTSRGQQLPVGSYYYIISVKNAGQVLSGSVAVLR